MSSSSSGFASGASFGGLLSHALQTSRTAAVEDIRLPWEIGVWSEIFGGRDEVLREARFTCPDVPHDFQSEGDGTPEVKKRRTECSDWKAGAIAFKVVRRKADVSWEDQRSKEHDRALARWLLVISRWDDCWPDLEIVKAMASIPDNEGRKDSLLDWLHPRAPATLIKRVNSILLYHKEVGWGQDVVPYREHSVYCYMRDAKAGGAKPSQLSSLREALIFVRFVFDVPSLDTIVKSRRILGITRRGAKRGRTKAHPLRVCDLEVLHTILESADSAWDKLFSGACLACLYMRARWSDFQHTCAFSIDYSDEHEPVYLEFRAEVFKTMNAKFFDGEPMIWVAPAQGIYRHNWVKLWLQVRQELELESFQPPLPVPRESGGATAGAVLTGEITAWLQRVLPGRDGLRTTAHSLKRTCLSWANKRGFDPRDKLILGGHAHDAPMVDRYGDDFAARPLRLLEELLSEIRSGAFRPDASRAGRLVTVQGSSEVHDSLPGSWAEVSDPVSIPVPDEECDEDVASPDSPNMSCLNAEEAPAGSGVDVNDVPPVEPASSSSSSSSDDSSESSREVVSETEAIRADFRIGVPVPPVGCCFVQHKVSRILHYRNLEYNKVLVCGRGITDVYQPPGLIRFDSSVCRTCKRRAIADGL